MGTYNDRWAEIVKMADEVRGTGEPELLPECTWWDNIPVYLDAVRYFLSVILLLFLYTWLFYLWLDVIKFLVNW